MMRPVPRLARQPWCGEEAADLPSVFLHVCLAVGHILAAPIHCTEVPCQDPAASNHVSRSGREHEPASAHRRRFEAAGVRRSSSSSSSRWQQQQHFRRQRRQRQRSSHVALPFHDCLGVGERAVGNELEGDEAQDKVNARDVERGAKFDLEIGIRFPIFARRGRRGESAHLIFAGCISREDPDGKADDDHVAKSCMVWCVLRARLSIDRWRTRVCCRRVALGAISTNHTRHPNHP